MYFSYGPEQALILAPFMLVILLRDNFLQPFIVRKHVTLSAWLILIGAMGGVSALGLAGLFISPMILSVACAMIRN